LPVGPDLAFMDGSGWQGVYDQLKQLDLRGPF
jgi:hypothetical protein